MLLHAGYMHICIAKKGIFGMQITGIKKQAYKDRMFLYSRNGK
jgi:hypothetical protein